MTYDKSKEIVVAGPVDIQYGPGGVEIAIKRYRSGDPKISITRFESAAGGKQYLKLGWISPDEWADIVEAVTDLLKKLEKKGDGDVQVG